MVKRILTCCLAGALTLLPAACFSPDEEGAGMIRVVEPSPVLPVVTPASAVDADEDELHDPGLARQVRMGYYGFILDLPPGWSMEEELRNEESEPAALKAEAACAWYELHDSGTVHVRIRPDCGYADAGPADCPEGASLLGEPGDSRGIARWQNQPTGLYFYSRVGSAVGTMADGSQETKTVCYAPPVVGIPVADPVITAAVSVQVGEGGGEESLILVDQLLFSIRAE